MIPKKVYISVAVWDEGRKYDFLEVRERPYQTTDTQCHWREYTDLSQVWHDASEEPQYKDKRILVYSEYFDYSFMDFPNYLIMKDGGQNKDWGTVVWRNKISKWAYVSDLFPNQFRNSEQLKGGER